MDDVVVIKVQEGQPVEVLVNGEKFSGTLICRTKIGFGNPVLQFK